MTRLDKKALEQIADSPVGWFVALERARERNDFEHAANAIRQLRRHGIKVEYLPNERQPLCAQQKRVAYA